MQRARDTFEPPTQWHTRGGWTLTLRT